MSFSERHVGLFGGSFNPPHVCHLLLSIYLVETGRVDEVWWLPVHQHAFAKHSELADWDSRLAMCEAISDRWQNIQTVDIEARLPPPSYTFDTIAALRNEHITTRFSWIIGSDLLGELPLWHRWPELRQILDFIVVGRGEGSQANPEGGRFDHLDFALPDISSTQIRALLGAGDLDAARILIPSEVADFLRAHPELYR